MLPSFDEAPSRRISTQPSANIQRGVSPAGYITHHCSAVSAVLCSAKHRMARPPGYATGAHVLAGCLPDRGCWSSLTLPTLSTVFSKHVSGYINIYIYIWLTLDGRQFLWGDYTQENADLIIVIKKL